MSKKTNNDQPKVTETISKELYDDISDLSENVADALIDIAVKHHARIFSVFDFYVSFFTFIVDSVKQRYKESGEKAKNEEKTENKEDNN